MKMTPARLAGACIAIVAMMLGNPTTASASGPMQHVGGAGCWSAGGGNFDCFDNFTGGTAPYTATGSTSGWATISSIVFDSLGSDEYEVHTSGQCTIGKSSTVSVTVTDSVGQTLRLTSVMRCTSWSQE
jgi:hypothetical protein